MPRKNDVSTVDKIIDVCIEMSNGSLTRSMVRRELTFRDLLMENSRYNKHRGKKTGVSSIRRPNT